MKKIFRFPLLGMLLSGLLLGSCGQMTGYENEDLDLQQSKITKSGDFDLIPLEDNRENAMVGENSLECVSQSQVSAFAYQPGNCFIDPGNKGKGKGGRWGWYIDSDFTTIQGAGGMISYPLFAGAALCNTEGGIEIGEVRIMDNEDGTVTISYHVENTDPEAEQVYILGNIHVYAACSSPNKLAPGNYGNTSSGMHLGDGAYEASVTINSADISCGGLGAYIIAHAEITICERG